MFSILVGKQVQFFHHCQKQFNVFMVDHLMLYVSRFERVLYLNLKYLLMLKGNKNKKIKIKVESVPEFVLEVSSRK